MEKYYLCGLFRIEDNIIGIPTNTVFNGPDKVYNATEICNS